MNLPIWKQGLRFGNGNNPAPHQTAVKCPHKQSNGGEKGIAPNQINSTGVAIFNS